LVRGKCIFDFGYFCNSGIPATGGLPKSTGSVCSMSLIKKDKMKKTYQLIIFGTISIIGYISSCKEKEEETCPEKKEIGQLF
jgi:hypothetical protein